MENRVKLEARYKPEYSTVKIREQEIQVRKQITYDEKLQYAQEYTSAVCAIDDVQEMMYEAFDDGSIQSYLLLKYYTNIDVDEFESNMETLYDAVLPYMDVVRDACFDDAIECERTASKYMKRAIEIYNTQHSLSQKIKTMLGGILDVNDIGKLIAESKFVNEEMVDLLQKAKEREDQKEEKNVVLFPWAGKKGE